MRHVTVVVPPDLCVVPALLARGYRTATPCLVPRAVVAFHETFRASRAAALEERGGWTGHRVTARVLVQRPVEVGRESRRAYREEALADRAAALQVTLAGSVTVEARPTFGTGWQHAMLLVTDAVALVQKDASAPGARARLALAVQRVPVVARARAKDTRTPRDETRISASLSWHLFDFSDR